MPAPSQSAMTTPPPTITPNDAPPHPDLECLPKRAVGQDRSSESKQKVLDGLGEDIINLRPLRIA